MRKMMVGIMLMAVLAGCKSSQSRQNGAFKNFESETDPKPTRFDQSIQKSEIILYYAPDMGGRGSPLADKVEAAVNSYQFVSNLGVLNAENAEAATVIISNQAPYGVRIESYSMEPYRTEKKIIVRLAGRSDSKSLKTILGLALGLKSNEIVFDAKENFTPDTIHKIQDLYGTSTPSGSL